MANPVESPKSLNDPIIKARVKDLSGADNVTNIWFLARTWVYFIAVIGATISFFEFRESWGLGWWWNVPVVLLAVILVGAGQHQLTGLAHEASHHTLFKNRKWNDYLSDWLCMFPMFSTTHHYRLQHIAHHQFTNDPDRDPDVSQLKSSGHWLNFPISKSAFLWTLLKQLWLPNLIRYIRIRAVYSSLGTDKNPYSKSERNPSMINKLVGIGYLIVLTVSLWGLVSWGSWPALVAVPMLLGAGVITYFALAPEASFSASRLKPVYSIRTMTIMRMLFLTMVFSAIAWIGRATHRPVAGWLLLLWVVPIFTSFSFFMILRQLVQHGNADRGWLTNTRTFLVNPLIRFAVFPLGQDYHLPHHMFASVPHYRLKELHEALMTCDEYRTNATVVEGYFTSPIDPPRNPTVLDIVGPNYACRSTEIHLDHSVLDHEDVEDMEELMKEGMEPSSTLSPERASATNLASSTP